MKKIIKITLSTLLTIVLLALIAVFAITQWVNPNQFKEPIQNHITDITGRDTQINGDITWQFYPWIGFGVHAVTIENAPGFTADDFATVDKIILSVKVMPLFDGNVDVGTITVDGLRLNLEIDQQGRTNWADLAENSNTPPALPQENSHNSSGYFNLNKLHIGEVNFSNGQLSLRNANTEQTFSLNDINLETNELILGQPFPVSLAFTVDAKQQSTNLFHGDIRFNGDVTVAEGAFDANADLMSLLTIDGKVSMNKLAIDKLNIDKLHSDLNINHKIIKLDPIKASLYQGSANAKLHADFNPTAPKFELEQTLSDIEAGGLFKDLIGSERITGKAELALQLTTQGEVTSDLVKNLNGQAKFAFHEGTIQGIDLSFLIDWATAVFQRKPQPQDQNQSATAFGALTGSTQVKSGVITNTDLLLKSPYYNVNGKGMIDLNKQYIDYRLETKLLQLSEGSLIYKMQKAVGGTLPIIVRGSYGSIHAEPDVDIIIKSGAQSFVEEQLGRVLGGSNSVQQPTDENGAANDEHPSNAINQAKDLIEGLFGN